MKLKHNIKGMTIAESIAGFAVLTLVLALLYSNFLVAGRIFSQGEKVEQTNQGAFTEVELMNATSSSVFISVPLGGKTMKFSAKFYSAGNKDDGSALYSLVSSAANDNAVALSMRENFYTWKEKIDATSPADRVLLGYPKATDNSSMRKWLAANVYHDTWPELSEGFYNHLVSDYGLSKGTYYVMPYNTPPGTDAEVNCFVYASTSPGINGAGENWSGVRMIFDHGEKAWYVGVGFGKDIMIAGKTWAVVRQEMDTKGWVRVV